MSLLLWLKVSAGQIHEAALQQFFNFGLLHIVKEKLQKISVVVSYKSISDSMLAFRLAFAGKID